MIAIAIPTFGRLDLLYECLRSLRSCGGVWKADVWLFPDLVDDEEFRKVNHIFDQLGFDGGVLQRPERRLYACRNIIRSMREAATLGEYTHILRMDSDIIVEPGFIDALVSAANTIGGAAASDIVCELPLNEKLECRDVLDTPGPCGPNICMSTAHWRRIEPMVTRWEDLFLNSGCVPKMRNGDLMRRYMRDLMTVTPEWHEGRDPFVSMRAGTTIDGFMACALAFCGIPFKSLVVNRCVHPSSEGENTTAEYHADRYARTELQDLTCKPSS